MHERRTDHTATRLLDGRVLVSGGSDTFRAVDSAELYQPGTTSFRPTRGAPIEPTYGHAAARLLDGRVLLTGGRLTSDRPTDRGSLFDPTSETFDSGPCLEGADERLAAFASPDGSAVLCGGWPVAAIARWDGQTITRLGSCALCASVALPRGVVVLFDSEGGIHEVDRDGLRRVGDAGVSSSVEARANGLPDGSVLLTGSLFAGVEAVDAVVCLVRRL